MKDVATILLLWRDLENPNSLLLIPRRGKGQEYLNKYKTWLLKNCGFKLCHIRYLILTSIQTYEDEENLHNSRQSCKL